MPLTLRLLKLIYVAQIFKIIIFYNSLGCKYSLQLYMLPKGCLHCARFSVVFNLHWTFSSLVITITRKIPFPNLPISKLDSSQQKQTDMQIKKEICLCNHEGRGRELERKGLERSGHHGIFVILLKDTLMNTEKQWTCPFPAIK